MKISVSGHKMAVGQAFTTYAEDKLKHSVLPLCDHAMDAQVTLVKNGHHAIKADIRVHAGKGIEICSSAEEHDPHVAFDKALLKVDSQLRRYQNRLKSHHRKTGEAVKIAQYVMKTPQEEHDHDHDHDHDHHNNAPLIIAETMVSMPVLTVAEAVMRLDLAQTEIFVFKSAKTGAVNVIHRRQDGHIGWIDANEEK